jgi:acetolactate synthase-1/3 small subunit
MSDRIPATTDKKPSPQADIINIHTLSVYVNNQPGVLGRICNVFSRRGFNIESLVVSQTRNPRFSRMTIGISGHPEGLHQIIMQVNKLIDVIHCQEHTDRDAVSKEMVLVKIAAGPDNRTEILQIVGHYSGKTVDLQEDSLICLLSGNTDKLDASIRLLSKFEIIETIRTGKVVMARGLTDT